MPHILLICDLAADYFERRDAMKAPHIAHLWGAMERGEMILGGVAGDPLESALYLFRSEEAARAFIEADPYYQAGLFTGWRTLPWTTIPDSRGESVIPA